MFERLREWVIDCTKYEIEEHHILTESSNNKERLIQLQTSLAKLYQGQGKYESTEPYESEQMITLYGENRINTLTILESIVCLYEDQGRYELAKKQCEEYHEKAKQLRHTDHIILALPHLARITHLKGNLSQTEILYQQCYEQIQNHFVGGELLHRETLDIMTNIGEYEKAEEYYQTCYQQQKVQIIQILFVLYKI